jgi:hypothetical protein
MLKTANIPKAAPVLRFTWFKTIATKKMMVLNPKKVKNKSVRL